MLFVLLRRLERAQLAALWRYRAARHVMEQGKGGVLDLLLGLRLLGLVPARRAVVAFEDDHAIELIQKKINQY